MLKSDFHVHTNYSFIDRIKYTPKNVLKLAHKLGYDVLSITDHDSMEGFRQVKNYAKKLGILLVPGVELTLDKKHVLALDMPKNLLKLDGWPHYGLDILQRLKDENVFLIAPHPTFPFPYALNGGFLKNIRYFDAVEYNAYYSKEMNFNRKAIKIAKERGMPVIANSDLHKIEYFNITYSLIDADKNTDSVLEAIRKNKIKIITKPISFFQFVKNSVSPFFRSIYYSLRY